MHNAIRLFLLCLIASPSMSLLRAQIGAPEGAVFDGATVSGLASGIRLEDWNRKLTTGGRSETFEMTRAVVGLQVPFRTGTAGWLEGGWNEIEQGGRGGKGGVTWGGGINSRLFRAVRRADPEAGPRDWTAVKFEAGARGGEAPAHGQGNLEWFQWEGRLGLEWQHRYLGADRGPIYTTGRTLEGGLLWTDLQADRVGFKGSARQNFGIYLRASFDVGPSQFFGLEADWMGSSDRRYAVVGGFRF
ncbi:MAG: hypothetical protein LAT83_19000 [Kiritimatiellae bacterium]|nr:hypothetical protein [Kiritimatiellia bacterium]